MGASQPGVSFGRVTETSDRIAIVALGPSLRDVDLDLLGGVARNGVCVLTVNRALSFVPHSQVWFTLDPDDRILPLMRDQCPETKYYAAVPLDYATPGARVFYHRVTPPEGVTWLVRHPGKGPLKSHYKLSEDPRGINTGNSVWGALGLAYHMRASRIGLFGVDATRRGYAFGGGDPRGPLGHLPELFHSAVGQLQARKIQVRNGSPKSRVKCFERTDANKVLRWLDV